MTMQTPPFQNVSPIENGDLSLAMLDYWRVSTTREMCHFFQVHCSL